MRTYSEIASEILWKLESASRFEQTARVGPETISCVLAFLKQNTEQLIKENDESARITKLCPMSANIKCIVIDDITFDRGGFLLQHKD